jgi:hypothetical protein
MNKTRSTETLIVKALKELEAGRKLEDLSCVMEVSEATFYK